MTLFADAVAWLADPAHWGGPAGIGARVAEHLAYAGLALALAAVVALPLGLYVGHTGRLRGLAVAASGALRALPTLGLLTLLTIALGLPLECSIVPSTLVLAVLAMPPLLAGAYAGVEAIDPATIDGARAIGLSEAQIVAGVEVPLAAPMLLGGVRSAVLQVLATATVSAYLGLGGLGRFLLDGLAIRDFPQMLGGALVVIALALLADGALALAQRLTLTPGVRAALGADAPTTPA